MAIPAPDEEDVKRLWCSQVLWVEKKLTCSHSGNLAEDKQMLTPGKHLQHARRLPELMLLYLHMKTETEGRDGIHLTLGRETKAEPK